MRYDRSIKTNCVDEREKTLTSQRFIQMEQHENIDVIDNFQAEIHCVFFFFFLFEWRVNCRRMYYCQSLITKQKQKDKMEREKSNKIAVKQIKRAFFSG